MTTDINGYVIHDLCNKGKFFYGETRVPYLQVSFIIHIFEVVVPTRVLQDKVSYGFHYHLL